MNVKKKKFLEAAGWRVGSTDDFLSLTDEEAAYIDLKITLSKNVRQCRERENLTQTQLAECLKSSQSRVAKIEAGDPSVSVDSVNSIPLRAWGHQIRTCQNARIAIDRLFGSD